MRKVTNLFKFLFILWWSIFMSGIGCITAIVTFTSKVAVKLPKLIWGPVVLRLLGVKVHQKGHEKAGEGPFVVICNHVSFADIPVLFKVFKEDLHFIAKSELKWYPLVGWYIFMSGMIFVKRGNRQKSKKSMEKAARLIRKGKSVVLFPEGTRSKDGAIGSFKKGAFMLARDSGVKIIPVAISGTEITWPKKFLESKPFDVSVNVGEPIQPEDYPENLNDLISMCRQRVVDLKAV